MELFRLLCTSLLPDSYRQNHTVRPTLNDRKESLALLLGLVPGRLRLTIMDHLFSSLTIVAAGFASIGDEWREQRLDVRQLLGLASEAASVF